MRPIEEKLLQTRIKNIGFDGYIGNLIYEYIDEYFDKKYQ